MRRAARLRAEDRRTREVVAHQYADAWVLLGALGRLGDDASLEFLTGVATGGDTDETTALVAAAAIARRGGPAGAAAIRTLVERSREDWDAWTLLVAVAPRAGARALCARLLAEKDLVVWDSATGGARALVENAYRLGVRVPPDALLGSKPRSSAPSPRRRRWRPRPSGSRAAHAPCRHAPARSCSRPMLPPSLLEEEPGPWWNDEVLDETIGFLLGPNPYARRPCLPVGGAAGDDGSGAGRARRCSGLGDRPSLAMLLPWLRARGRTRFPVRRSDTAARLRLPEVVQLLRAWIEALPPNHEASERVAPALVVALGWPDEVG
jgi:hypothetical protein